MVDVGRKGESYPFAFDSITGVLRPSLNRPLSISSSPIAQNAVVRGMGCFKVTKPVYFHVAFGATSEPETLRFFRVWKVPRPVSEISAARLVLLNRPFTVADAVLACEDLLIGHPVPRRLNIDSRTFSERNRSALDGSDCASVEHPVKMPSCGSFGRLMIARLQHVSEEILHTRGTLPDSIKADLHWPQANYFVHK